MGFHNTTVRDFENMQRQEKLISHYQNLEKRYQRLFIGFGLTLIALGVLSIFSGLLYHYGVIQLLIQKAGVAYLGAAKAFIADPVFSYGSFAIFLGTCLAGFAICRKKKVHHKIRVLFQKLVTASQRQKSVPAWRPTPDPEFVTNLTPEEANYATDKL